MFFSAEIIMNCCPIFISKRGVYLLSMTAIEKEQIFTELRKYHTEEFPMPLTNKDMTSLLSEFRGLEDRIISMLLSLVSGKVAFVDLSSELKAFKQKVKIKTSGDRDEDITRTMFLSKLAQLSQIMNIAEVSTFKIKIPRVARRFN